MPIFNVYHAMTAAEIAPERKEEEVLVLKTTDSVETAVKKLEEASVLAAPVVDETGALVGFIDRLDIATHIADCTAVELADASSLKIAGRAISLVNVGQVLNKSGNDALIEVFADSPASEVLTFFANGQHRCVLFTAEKEVANIISQSDFVNHMAKHLMYGPTKEIAAKKLSELGYTDGHVKLTTVLSTATVQDAVLTMKKEGVSALAVVDASGKLVGNFSASDLKGLFRQRVPEFTKSVGDFLTAHSPSSMDPVTLKADATLLEAAEILAWNKLHHVFVLGEEGAPLAIVSSSDLMKIAAANKE